MITINDFPYTIYDLQNACANNKILWKDHATQRLLQRKIPRKNVMLCILNGEIIEKYISDKPFASCLVFGYAQIASPLHVVCSFDGEYIHIITAYVPDTIKFLEDLKTRREI